MTDELPEWPADSGDTDEADSGNAEEAICERIANFLQRALNDRPNGLGSQVLAQWVLVAEVALSDGRAFRVFDSDQPWWHKDALLTAALEHSKDMRNTFTYGPDDDDEEDA